MLLRFTILIAILFAVELTTAQIELRETDIKYGDLFRNESDYIYEKIIAKTENGTIVWLTDESTKTYTKTVLKFYNSDMNMSDELVFDFKHKNGFRNFITMIDFKDKILLFSSYTDIFRKKVKIYVETVHKVLFQKGDIHQISSFNYQGSYYKGVLDVVASPDSSKFAILSTHRDGTFDQEHIFVQCYKNINVMLWSREIKIPFLSTYYEHSVTGSSMIYTYTLSDFGDFYFAYLAFENTKLYKRNNQPYNSFTIVRMSQKKVSSDIFKAERNNSTLNSLTLIPNPIDSMQVICTGYYSAIQSADAANGLFTKVFDYNLQLMLKDTVYPFSIELKKEFMKERQAKKGLELFNFNINEFIYMPDSTFFLVAEQQMDYAFNRAGSNNFNNILLSKISYKGVFLKNIRIPKSQSPNTDDYPHSSYAIMESGNDKVHFFFNDHPNNLFLDKTDRVFNFDHSKEAIFVMVTVDSDCSVKRETLFIIEEKDTYPCPTISYSRNSNEIIMLSKSFNFHRLMKIKIED